MLLHVTKFFWKYGALNQFAELKLFSYMKLHKVFQFTINVSLLQFIIWEPWQAVAVYLIFSVTYNTLQHHFTWKSCHLRIPINLWGREATISCIQFSRLQVTNVWFPIYSRHEGLPVTYRIPTKSSHISQWQGVRFTLTDTLHLHLTALQLPEESLCSTAPQKAP